MAQPSIYLGNLMRLPAFMKIGEIIMLIIAITMAQASNHVYFPGIHAQALFYGIVVGYLLVYLILITCYLIGETSTQRSKFELLLNGVGFILFFSLSIKMIVFGSDLWGKYSTQTIVVAVFLLMISGCQLVDAIFNFRFSRD